MIDMRKYYSELEGRAEGLRIRIYSDNFALLVNGESGAAGPGWPSPSSTTHDE